MIVEGLTLPDVPRAWFVRPNGFDASGTVHGLAHTLRVWVHAQALAQTLGLRLWQMEALHHAALWHDIGRVDDNTDYYHGARSAGRVIGLGLHEGLAADVREAALFSCTHHCGSERHAERALLATPAPAGYRAVFRVLKDADALDRVRIHDLDPDQLRHDESRARVPRALELLARLP